MDEFNKLLSKDYLKAVSGGSDEDYQEYCRCGYARVVARFGKNGGLSKEEVLEKMREVGCYSEEEIAHVDAHWDEL